MHDEENILLGEIKYLVLNPNSKSNEKAVTLKFSLSLNCCCQIFFVTILSEVLTQPTNYPLKYGISTFDIPYFAKGLSLVEIHPK